jgi:large subunit ribosomal protein L25
MAPVKEMKATARSRAGKGGARAERGAGRVPGVIYGDGKPPLNVSVDHADLKQRIYAGRFLTTIYELDVDGSKQRVIPRDYQLDPVKDLPVHVDFLRLGEGARIRVRIPIHVVNADQAPGVKRGGTVNIVTHSVEVQCPADEIPEAFDVDISGLEINYSKHLSDITLPSHVRVMERTDPTLVTIVPPSGYAEEMKAAAEAAAAAAAAAAAEAGVPAEGAAPGAAPGAPGAAPAAPGAAPGAAPAAAPAAGAAGAGGAAREKK